MRQRKKPALPQLNYPKEVILGFFITVALPVSPAVGLTARWKAHVLIIHLCKCRTKQKKNKRKEIGG
ncbi:hypothetical protein NXS19_002082 [Fusarium pseudograminearum]|nr:hypothetical protein NXS19_002082 [Fusarium pseudograminearum]